MSCEWNNGGWFAYWRRITAPKPRPDFVKFLRRTGALPPLKPKDIPPKKTDQPPASKSLPER